MHMTDAEVGLYTRLLCVQWTTGGLPDDDLLLSSYGKGKTPLYRVKEKFKKCKDGKLRNTRMELERKKQNAFRKSRSQNGKLGGRPCKASDNLVVNGSLSVGKARKSSPFPSPSPNGEGTPPKVSASVQLIRDTQELERVEKAIKAIRSGYSEHQAMTSEDRAKIAPLKSRRAELLNVVGFKV